jgi:thioredoxin reductase (NADPH)
MTEIPTRRVIIIGGGPAGYTAALYSSRARLEPICFEGYASGGQIARSARVENFPGHAGGVSGAELSDLIRHQAVEFGATVVTDDVQSVDLSARPFQVKTADREYAADALIVATGASSRRLGLPSEDEFDGRGVCYCAVCDGPFFNNQRVVVVGGGDAAAEEALMLSNIAESVVMVHRRRDFRATATILGAVAETANIRMLTPVVVDEVLGGDLGVTGVRVRDTESGVETTLPADGVFVAIGHEPASALFTDWLEADENGFLQTAHGTTETRVPGVFVAGDVGDPRYRQAITAAASGCSAAIDAERWLMSRRGHPKADARAQILDVARMNAELADQAATDPAATAEQLPTSYAPTTE